MLVVLVMNMFVVVPHCFMNMLVIMPLSQVQPDPCCHQHAGDKQWNGNGFAHEYRNQGAEEGGNGKISACARSTEVAQCDDK